MSEHEFYGNYVKHSERFLAKLILSYRFEKIVTHYKNIGYNMDIQWRITCMAVNRIMIKNFASFFSCRIVRRIRLKASYLFSLFQTETVGAWLSMSVVRPISWSCLWFSYVLITKTCLYNIDPLKPLFYIVKLGFTGVYIIFVISAQKYRLWVLVRTASTRRF